jgi:hypothetical protein
MTTDLIIKKHATNTRDNNESCSQRSEKPKVAAVGTINEVARLVQCDKVTPAFTVTILCQNDVLTDLDCRRQRLHCSVYNIFTETSPQAVTLRALYSGGNWFESQLGHRQACCDFPQFIQDIPGQCPKLEHNRFHPHFFNLPFGIHSHQLNLYSTSYCQHCRINHEQNIKLYSNLKPVSLFVLQPLLSYTGQVSIQLTRHTSTGLLLR